MPLYSRVTLLRSRSLRSASHARGRLLGSLAVVAVLALLITAGIYLGVGYRFGGFELDRGLKAAMTLVRHDSVAQEVLGDGIKIERVEGREFFLPVKGEGDTSTHTVRLRGSKAEGVLHVTLHSSGHDLKIVAMVLTGPDGERHILAHDQAPVTGQSE